jgi:hypothetical protein
VCPSGIGNSWNAGLCCGGNTQDDVGFSRAVVSQVRGAVSSVQGSKVFTSGFSNGGMLSMRLVCQASDVFQGALNAGGKCYGTPYFGYLCSSSVNRQVLHLHGTADSVIGWNGANNAYQAYVSQIQGCPSSFSTIYTNPAYFNMQCWERRSAPLPPPSLPSSSSSCSCYPPPPPPGRAQAAQHPPSALTQGWATFGPQTACYEAGIILPLVVCRKLRKGHNFTTRVSSLESNEWAHPFQQRTT